MEDQIDEDSCIDLELENLVAENDPFLSEYKKKKLKELQQTVLNSIKDTNLNHGGILYTASKEAEVFEWTTKEPLVIIHFFLPSFKTCGILDQHLKKLAHRYPLIRWGRMDVSNAPFLTQKLSIKVLPCLDIFINGIKTDRIKGFDDLGGSSHFTTLQLEKRISLSGSWIHV